MRTTRHPDPLFDPEQVPVFPVLTLELTADGGARVNGRDLTVNPGEDPIDVGVAAAAELAQELPGQNPAIRVRGVDVRGEVFPIVVRADGSAHELVPVTPSPSRPRWLWPVVASTTALVVGAAAATAVVLTRDERTKSVTAVATLPGAGANLPLLAPSGYSQRATWAVPIRPQVPPIATPAGDILAVTEGGDLTLLDDRTGRTLWIGQDAPVNGKLHLVLDRGRPVAAKASARELTLWPLPTAPTTTSRPKDAATPVTIPLPARAEVTFDGSAPLIRLPDQTAALIRQGALIRVDVPVGATPIAADENSVIATTATTTWYDIAPGRPPVARTLQRPAGTAGATMQALAGGADHLVTTWTYKDGVLVALHDLTTGRVVASAKSTAAAGRQDVHRQTGGTQLTVGRVLVDYGPAAAVIALPPTFTPTTVTSGHAYGEVDKHPADVMISDGRAVLTPPPALVTPAPDGGTRIEIAQPIATTPQHAYVPARKVEQFLLYAIPSTGGTSP